MVRASTGQLRISGTYSSIPSRYHLFKHRQSCIVLATLFETFDAYGVSANFLASKLKGNATTLVHRIGSVFLIGAAITLGLKTLREEI